MVELCRTSGKSIAEVSQDLGLTVSAVRRWVAQADIDGGRRPGLTSDEHAGAGPAPKGEQGVARRARHLEACHSFLRQGDPMNVYPFIEAEKAEPEGNVAMACQLLEVSRSAYYEWSSGTPSARELSDAELAEKIVDIFTKSRRTYGAPRITTKLAEEGIRVGKKRVARLMVLRGLVGRAKRRFKRTTIADPDGRVERDRPDRTGLRARGPRGRHRLVRRHHLRAHLGGLALPGHGDRPGEPTGRRLRHGRPHAGRSRLRRPRDGHHAASTSTRADLPLRPRIAIHLGDVPQAPQANTTSPSRSRDPASAGTTPWPKAGSRH